MQRPRTAAGTRSQTDTPLAPAWEPRRLGLTARGAGAAAQQAGWASSAGRAPEAGSVQKPSQGAQRAWPGWTHCTRLQRALRLGFSAAQWGPLRGTCCVQDTFTVSPRLPRWEFLTKSVKKWILSWKLCQVIWFGRGWSLPWKGIICPRPWREYALCRVGPGSVSLRAAGSVEGEGLGSASGISVLSGPEGQDPLELLKLRYS